MIGSNARVLEFLKRAVEHYSWCDFDLDSDCRTTSFADFEILKDAAANIIDIISDPQYSLLHASHLKGKTWFDMKDMCHRVSVSVGSSAEGQVTEIMRLHGQGVVERYIEDLTTTYLRDCLARPAVRESIFELYDRKAEEMIDRFRQQRNEAIDGGDRQGMTRPDATRLLGSAEATEEKQSGQS